MRKCSRLLCTTAGKHARAHTHTHTHTHTNCGDDWFGGFIGASQSHQAGQEKGAGPHFQERRHLLQLNHGCFPRGRTRTTGTQFYLPYYYKSTNTGTWRAQRHFTFFTRYRITDTDTWRTLNTFFFIFFLTHRHILSRNKWELSTKSYRLSWLGCIKVLWKRHSGRTKVLWTSTSREGKSATSDSAARHHSQSTENDLTY